MKSRGNVSSIRPYDLQELVAGLLRAMSYYISYTAPPGPDRGVDIVAHPDALGLEAPRIEVHVKRRGDKVAGEEMGQRDQVRTGRALQLNFLRDSQSQRPGFRVQHAFALTHSRRKVRSCKRQIRLHDFEAARPHRDPCPPTMIRSF